jgi:hypothetical protein
VSGAMKTKTIAFALGALAIVAGCTSANSSNDGSTESQSTASEDLIFVSGSVDHVGIVESTTMMLVGNPTEFATVLDPYNQEDPFAIKASSYRAAFAKNLGKFDSRDGTADWTQDQIASWAQRMASGNYQIVDTSKPCDWDSPHTYLEIERAHLTGRAHETCGGRMPNEDAMDVTLNFLVRGPSASVDDDGALHDGVEQATQRSNDEFPYLADLNE